MSAAATYPSLLRPPPRQADLQRVDLVRITGVLEYDAHVRYSAGANPRAWVVLEIVPPRGLRYQVLQDLGTDPTDHMQAEARAVGLRRGALVSATGSWLRLRTDHGHAVLVLEECTGVITHAPASTAAQVQENDPCAK
jgi:hypothetical protein